MGDPVSIVGRATYLCEDGALRKASPGLRFDPLEVGKDEHGVVERVAVQFEENARAPAAVTIVVIIHEYNCTRARRGHESALPHVEVDAEVHETAGPFEIAALQNVRPVLEIAAIRPHYTKTRVDAIKEALADCRVEERVCAAGKQVWALLVPAQCFLVEVYFTEWGSPEFG
jgi:hypothetical protein